MEKISLYPRKTRVLSVSGSALATGQGDGEFSFGEGSDADDFAGSIVVDGERGIYVVDVGNKWIQKFVPLHHDLTEEKNVP